jgi:hypothetical protein
MIHLTSIIFLAGKYSRAKRQAVISTSRARQSRRFRQSGTPAYYGTLALHNKEAA